jgi:hypothetical protein
MVHFYSQTLNFSIYWKAIAWNFYTPILWPLGEHTYFVDICYVYGKMGMLYFVVICYIYVFLYTLYVGMKKNLATLAQNIGNTLMPATTETFLREKNESNQCECIYFLSNSFLLFVLKIESCFDVARKRSGKVFG